MSINYFLIVWKITTPYILAVIQPDAIFAKIDTTYYFIKPIVNAIESVDGSVETEVVVAAVPTSIQCESTTIFRFADVYNQGLLGTALVIDRKNIHAWTDSLVVFIWLGRWVTFAGNTIAEILTAMCENQWSHVRSQANPADCASRGANPSACAGLNLWIRGPNWLWGEKINYRKGKINKIN